MLIQDVILVGSWTDMGCKLDIEVDASMAIIWIQRWRITVYYTLWPQSRLALGLGLGFVARVELTALPLT